MLTDEEAAFLRARLDEDEAAAKTAASVAGPEWAWHTDVTLADEVTDYLTDPDGTLLADTMGGSDGDIAAHIARHDPARVLREVEADRKLLDLYERAKGYRDRVFALHPPRSVSDEMRAVTQMMALEQVLKLRAAVYSGAQADGTGPHSLAEE